MRVYGLVQDSIVDGPGLRFVCFVQGCPHHCPGCHNPGSHSDSSGAEVSTDNLIRAMLSNPLTDGLTLSGGEPFMQPAECLVLAKAAHDSGLNVWCYTGWTYEHLMEHGTDNQHKLLQEIDVLVDGPYVQAQRSMTLPWRGSTNQRVINVQQSLAAGRVILQEV